MRPGERRIFEKDDTLYYVLTDQLGSTSVTTDNAGAKVSELRYKPWGEERFWDGVTPTDYTYTGQYSNMSDDVKLMFYNARWYDPALGRFAQADTVVPDGVQGYDRYAYVGNNPVGYSDPTGHDPIPDYFTGLFKELGRTLAWFSPQAQKDLAIQPDESDAMLVGRLTTDVAAMVGGAAAIAEGSGGATLGVAACGTGAGCLVGSVAIVAAAALILEGAGAGLKGAEGAAATLARFAAQNDKGWQTHSGETRKINGYKVRVDWEAIGSDGNVHITIDGRKEFISDLNDLDDILPKGLRGDGWIRREVERALDQMKQSTSSTRRIE